MSAEYESHLLSVPRPRDGSKPLLLLDCDGVLSDFVGHILDTIRSASRREELDVWYFVPLLPEHEQEMLFEVLAEPTFWATLPVIPAAKEGVRALSEIFDIEIVSSPWHACPDWERQRRLWLHREFGFRADQFTSTINKHFIEGAALLDDRTATVNRWSESHPAGLAMLIDTPHNRKDEVRHDVHRITWEDLISRANGSGFDLVYYKEERDRNDDE